MKLGDNPLGATVSWQFYNDYFLSNENFTREWRHIHDVKSLKDKFLKNLASLERSRTANFCVATRDIFI